MQFYKSPNVTWHQNIVLWRSFFRFSVGMVCVALFSTHAVARDLAKLLPEPKEMPKGVSLVKPTPELLKEAPAWAKMNPAIVTSAADRKEALKDYQPDALDLTRLRSLAVFVFECETPQGIAASTGIAVYAVELADSNVVKEWQKTVMEAMTKFRFQRVRFVTRENRLLWLVYSQDAEAECGTLERTMTKKLEDFAKAEHKATSGR